MGYQKQNFANGQVLNSAQLNHIEDGIVDLESAANATKGVVDKIIDPTLSLSGKAADAKATGDAIQNLAAGIATETKRAAGEEQRLNTAITAETTRAEQAEQALDTRTAALESCGFVVVDGKICVKYVKR